MARVTARIVNKGECPASCSILTVEVREQSFWLVATGMWGIPGVDAGDRVAGFIIEHSIGEVIAAGAIVSSQLDASSLW